MRIPFNIRQGLFLAFLLIPMLCLLSGQAKAQSGQSAPPVNLTATPAEPAVLQPRLNVRGAETPVRLVSLSISTQIQGGFAESSLAMEFYNPNGRILEGELEFPLIPGQEISGLALDINGKLRQGVPVGKARGQEIFDNIARRKVDPALLEATKGNAYRLRVYPLPAKGTRLVVVRILQPLKAENGAQHYRLPLAFADKIDTVSIEAEVISPEGEVKVESGNLGLHLEKTGTVFRGRAEHKNISPAGWLDISLPTPGSLPSSVTASRWGNKMYFSAAAYLAVPDKARVLPDKITILWDASGSGRQRDQIKEFVLLDSYFKVFGSGEVRLVVLRDKAETPKNFKIKNGDWQELRTAIHALVYDGATNLKDWTPAADCREYLLFSDGLDNYQGSSGKNEFPKLAQNQCLFAVNSAATADYSTLRSLAVRGALIDLAHESPALAEAKLLRESARVSILNEILAGGGEASLEPGSANLSPAEGQGGMVRLAGWVKKEGAKEITVQMDFLDGTSQKIAIPLPDWDKTQEFTIEDIPLQARLWGRYAIAALEVDYKTNKRSIARLSEQLGIVSRETSLIVLETADDYARYGVKPPASLQAQVDAISRRQELSDGEENISNERLLAMWQEKVRWWETDFTQKPKPKTSEVKKQETKKNDSPEVPAISDWSKRPPVNLIGNSKVYMGKKISLDFQNADIHNILRVIGEVSGKNIVVSDSVNGKVTLKLKDVPWDQVLDIVLLSKDLGVEESGNTLTVYDLATLNSISSTRQTAPAQRLNAAGVAPVDLERKVSPDVQRKNVAAERPEAANPADQLSTGSLNKAGTLLLNAQIDASDEVRTISSPRIMAADGQTVNIKRGQQIPYTTGSSANTAANISRPDTAKVSQPSSFRINPAVGAIGSSQASGARGAIESSQTFGARDVGLVLKPWVSNAPYIDRMKEAKDDELYGIYLDERPDYLNSSAFFINVADRFFERGLKDLGLRVLSNLAELQLENRQILRMLAYRLMQEGEMAAALPVLEKVRELAPYEPQSLRDIALAKAALNQPQEAVDLLYETARRKWSARFGEINTIALTEMNALIALNRKKIKTTGIDSRLIKNLASDIRVVLSWDMDNTNMDLWVTAPDGEAAYYSHKRTKTGGRMTSDCTQGYGPEEFMLKKAMPGTYRVEVKYSGHSRQTIAGEVTMIVNIFSKFGTPQQKEEKTTLRLEKISDKVLVAEFTVKK